jgi:YidC/Oxa1 family membrane protein insertase
VNIISDPLGKLLFFIYNSLAFRNYGLAIIIFTLLVKLILLPLTIKQTKSMARTNEIQPLIKEAQNRYKNDKEKLNQELMRIYKENNVNPTGGCLPLLIQFPILISLFNVITRPLQYLLGKSPEVITQLADFVKTKIGVSQHIEIQIMNYFNANPGELAQLNGALTKSELINFNFLGLNLGLTPTYVPGKLFGPELGTYLPLLIIPILGVLTTYFVSKFTSPSQKDSKNKKADQPAGMQSMQYIGPLITLIFSFQLPAGVGLYWIASNGFQALQQLYITKFVKEKKELNAAAKDNVVVKKDENLEADDSSKGKEGKGE